MDTPTTRRRLLQGTGVTLAAALAGCMGDGDPPENATNTTNATDSTNRTSTPTPTETPEPTEEANDGPDDEEPEEALGTLLVTLEDESGTPVTSDVSVTVEHEREPFSERYDEGIGEGRLSVQIEEAGAHTVTVHSPEETYETVEETVEVDEADETVAFTLVEREPEYDTSEIDEPSGALFDAPIPETPELHEFAVAGTGDAPVTATVYGGWKCSYTLRFVREVLPTVIEEFVRTGEVDLRFRAVGYRQNGNPYHGPDGVDAARAGLAVWYHDPAAYWRYFETFFHNMNQYHGWAETETVMAIAETAEVSDRRGIKSAVEGGAYRAQIDDTMEIATDYEMETIPRMVIGEDGDEDAEEIRASDLATVREALREAVDSA